jgi:hypothetical protein
MMKRGKALITRRRLGEHVPTAKITRKTEEELLEVLYTVLAIIGAEGPEPQSGFSSQSPVSEDRIQRRNPHT